MKTRIILTAACLTLATLCAQAQQAGNVDKRATVESRGDSIIIKKGSGDLRIRLYEQQTDEDSIGKEVEIYEGVYLERADEDESTFLDALPFIPQKKKNNTYKPHTGGLFYVGFSRLSNDFMNFTASDGAHLDISESWEFGFNLFNAYHKFKRNPHWGINIGLGWGYRSYKIDGNFALLKADGASYFQRGQTASDSETDATTYSGSRLRHFFFRVPVVAEWQYRLKKGGYFFVNCGPEFEIRHGVKSFSHIDGGKKETVGKGMYVRPVGVNLLAQAGIGCIGLWMRYSVNSLFQSDKGPDLTPCSFGVSLYL
ncbi:hypothetical protein [uncultured Bacteroides sp.]|uniref:hypothetical protein n=1 Tax=uncultured Bacteroides sp. TaxID=162156 RepID=UPI002625A2C7|nr:hypothetical protein [uncultured Bacteroides sp.]